MRKALVVGLGLIMAGTMALAADIHNHSMVMNNIVSVNEKGEKTALCG